jgi:dynactin-6
LSFIIPPYARLTPSGTSGIESPSIGDYNTFEPRCRVPATVSISDYCVIGAACSVAPDTPATASDFADLEKLVSSTPSHAQEDAQEPPQESTEQTQLQTQVDSLPSYTVVYGSENKRRIWSGEGKEQQKALFVKHLIYLRETLVKHHKLKLIT